VELRRSSFDSGPENSTSGSMKSDGASSAKNWLKD
jgi:hypothetical protein